MPTKEKKESATASLFGGQSVVINDKLDDLFKHSAGVSEIVNKPAPAVKFSSKDIKEQSKSREKEIENAAKASSTLDGLRKKRRASAMDDEEESGKVRKLSRLSKEEQEKMEKEKNERTIFVGNLSIECIPKEGYKQLKKYFTNFGSIESVRFRSVAFSEPIQKRAAFLGKKLHPDRDMMNAYIVFKDKSMANKALTSNGQLFMNKHICVDLVSKPRTHDRKRSVFLGSLPFDVQEEELWTFFSDCGAIESVRIIRDAGTNIGKGIGYVQFNQRNSVDLALALEEKPIRDKKKIRIQRCKIPYSEGGVRPVPKAAASSARSARTKSGDRPGKPGRPERPGRADRPGKPTRSGKSGKPRPIASQYEGSHASKATKFKIVATGKPIKRVKKTKK